MTKFYGIRNGIDQDIWDPLEDRFLPRSARLLPKIASRCAFWSSSAEPVCPRNFVQSDQRLLGLQHAVSS